VHVIWNPVRLTAVLQYIKNGIRWTVFCDVVKSL
jgi:hypothetical protein